MTTPELQAVRIHGPAGWLAGVHSLAPSARASVLVVPPFPHEWQRGYRLFALLAQGLASHGISCLRFDPTGCGDSAGEDEAFCLDQLADDSRLALGWLRAQGGGGPIVLLGVRAGALVASALASREGLDWIGWQPVISGANYLATLEARDARELRNPRRFGARLPAQGPDPTSLLGHRLHPGLRQQLRDAELRYPPRSSVDSELPLGLSRWVEEIDLATPFVLPLVRGVAADLARRLGARA